MRKLWIGGLLGFAIFSAVPASADVALITLTGTVTNSFDLTGIFGTANTTLDGDSYNLVFSVDTTKGHVVTAGPNFQELIGQATTNDGIPVTAVLTINGIPQQMGNYLGYNDISLNPASTYFRAVSENGNAFGAIKAYVISPLLPYSFSTPYLIDGINIGAGSFSNFDFGLLGPTEVDMMTYGDLLISNVSLTTVSSVPELSTWTMMLIGFVLLMIGPEVRSRWSSPGEVAHAERVVG